MDQPQIIGLAALAIIVPALIGLVKYLLKKPAFTDADRKQLTDLHEWHDTNDPRTGQKRWYNTHEQLEAQKYLVSTMRDMQSQQKDIGHTLVKIAEVLERIIIKLEK